MNSFRVLAGSQRPLTPEFLQELLGGVGPLDRSSAAVAIGKEAQDTLAHVPGAIKVVGARYLEDAIEGLQGATDIRVSREGVISVRVEDTDPQVAAAMTNFYVEQLDRLVAQ